MREILQAVADGELSPRAAEAELQGYVVEEAGRYDAARPARRGIPEAIVGEGKTADEIRELAETALETTDVALVTRLEEHSIDTLADTLDAPDHTVEVDERAALLRVETESPPTLAATVTIVTGGTADGPVAGEATAVLEAIGVTVDRIDDVGVAAIDRLLDERDVIDAADVAIVVAGREGSLPTVVAGLVSTPVIAVPTSTGYGAGGDGEAALMSALQSCTVLTTVNVDAGFVAGAQAGLIARTLDSARSGSED